MIGETLVLMMGVGDGLPTGMLIKNYEMIGCYFYYDISLI